MYRSSDNTLTQLLHVDSNNSASAWQKLELVFDQAPTRLERLLQGANEDVVAQLAVVNRPTPSPSWVLPYELASGGTENPTGAPASVQVRHLRLKYATYQRFVSIMNACEGMTIGRSWIVVVYTSTDWPVRHYWLSTVPSAVECRAVGVRLPFRCIAALSCEIGRVA